MSKKRLIKISHCRYKNFFAVDDLLSHLGRNDSDKYNDNELP